MGLMQLECFGPVGHEGRLRAHCCRSNQWDQRHLAAIDVSAQLP